MKIGSSNGKFQGLSQVTCLL